jgi:Spy/CpxP family protein refolding chaperone
MNTRLSKTISVLAVASLLTAGSVVAQNHKDDNDWQKRPPSTEEKLARISTALGLSDEQSVQMLVVLQQQTENRAALHEQKMELLGPEICAQRAETEDAILAILTAEQTELFLQIKEDRQNHPDRKGHASKRPGELDCPD